jgi:hypothetical protein
MAEFNTMYARAVVCRAPVSGAGKPSGPSSAAPAVAVVAKASMMFTSMFRPGSVPKAPEPLSDGVRVSESAIAQLQCDLKAIYTLFHDKCDEASFNDYMLILEDILELMVADTDSLGRQIVGRINQYPPSTQAVVDVARRCVALRDDLLVEDIVEIFEPIEPLVGVKVMEDFNSTQTYSNSAKRVGTTYHNVMYNT